MQQTFTISLDGITPAHAGKSKLGDNCTLGSRDHPRPCGEKHRKACGLTVKEGSPPPMRGKDVDAMSDV